jgi:sec-independent protein translocase protein TatC
MKKSTKSVARGVSEKAEKYLPYLEEIQKKLLTVTAGFFIAAALGFIYYRQILKFVMGQFNLEGINIVLTSPYQVISLAFNTALFTGTLVAIPLLVFHTLTFLRPALERKEYRLLTSLLPISLILFLSGFAFGVWVMQFVIKIFTHAALDFSIGNLWDISRFFSQILMSALSLGIVFQFPIVLTVLLRLKIVKYKQVITKRRHMYAASLIFAALLPPTDLLSLVLMVIPMVILFEFTLLFNRNQ